jgi:hypothetical protein
MLIILIFLAANEVFGQPSPKGFTYVVRNEKGDIMNSSELKKVVVKSINDNEAVMAKKYNAAGPCQNSSRQITVAAVIRKNTSIIKLREIILGKRTERHQSRKAEGQEKAPESERSDDGQPKAAGDQDAHDELRAIESGRKTKRKGHGRRAASDYSGAKIVKCRHEDLKAGYDCLASCGGRLYDLKEPTALMQFTGQPLITAIKYERETLRCAKCQQRYIAPLPEGVRDERYDATCDATIALMRYGGGLPWHRQAVLQAMGGVP